MRLCGSTVKIAIRVYVYQLSSLRSRCTHPKLVYVIHSTRAHSQATWLLEHVERMNMSWCVTAPATRTIWNYDIVRAKLVGNLLCKWMQNMLFETTQKCERMQMEESGKNSFERENNENIPFTQSTHWCKPIYMFMTCTLIYNRRTHKDG